MFYVYIKNELSLIKNINKLSNIYRIYLNVLYYNMNN